MILAYTAGINEQASCKAVFCIVSLVGKKCLETYCFPVKTVGKQPAGYYYVIFSATLSNPED